MNKSFEKFNTFYQIPQGYEVFTIFNEIPKNENIIYIVKDDKKLKETTTFLDFFFPEVEYLKFPAWDCLPYDRLSPNTNIIVERMKTLNNLSNFQNNKRKVLLTTINAVMQKSIPVEFVTKNNLTLSKGQSISQENVVQILLDFGFSRQAFVSTVGEFSIRGGIIDIFSPFSKNPVRLDFFGDKIDDIKTFDIDSQISSNKIDKMVFFPFKEIILNNSSIKLFRKEYRKTFGALNYDDPLYQSISEGKNYIGYEHWLPLFYENLNNIFDFIRNKKIVIHDTFFDDFKTSWNLILNRYENRLNYLENKESQNLVYKPISPERMYLSEKFIFKFFSEQKGLILSAKNSLENKSNSEFYNDLKKSRSFLKERLEKKGNLFNNVSDYIKKILKTKSVLVACSSKGSRDRMLNMINDTDIVEGISVDNINLINFKRKSLYFLTLNIECGFECKNFCIISEQDILGEKFINTSKIKNKNSIFLENITEFSNNDLVVHVEHGIGKYIGLKSIKTLDFEKDYLTIEYLDNDKLFLPVENIELLSKYGENTTTLDKLGAGSWQLRKSKIKKRINDIAKQLLDVAAERSLKTIEKISFDLLPWDEFCSSFPYNETEDQKLAISHVLKDLSSGKPMDRLICGDVGFGKTEIALRAAFSISMSGKQVAVICPTTLLSRQHYNNFTERFSNFPIKIGQLSRLVSRKKSEEIKKNTENGTIDIVIGTHALLSKNIKFSNLSLVIIDEEQHFGVVHKERLKEIKSDIHVLTLTATPIPRTLQLALSGARDLSLISTPPLDRLSVRTFISEFDPFTIRETILREFYRGGQSFFVVPRISDIFRITEFFDKNIPEVKYAAVNGQMKVNDLELIMTDFYDGLYDVLIATSIIDSGLDVPTANTLIVYNADLFGLSQLYQLRGRVGRSKIRAYAYFLKSNRKKLSPNAEKRLDIISKINSLGEGFNIASQDLDIRGAGNLIGDKQSGQIKEVGFELYQKMLKDTVKRIKSGNEKSEEIDNEWSPQLNLNVSSLIPKTYVSDLDLRLNLYRRFSNLKNKIDIEKFATELIDRFGPIPNEVQTLMNVVHIKNKCKKINIERIDLGEKNIIIKFFNNKFNNPEKLINYIQKNSNYIRIKTNKLIFSCRFNSEKDKFKKINKIINDIEILSK